VANAQAASAPLLLLGGAAPSFNRGKGSLQEMEQVDLFLRITKWADRIPSPELAPLYLAKAFRVAQSGRPGPVFLECAWDVLSNGAEVELPRFGGYRSKGSSPGDPRLVEEAIRILRKADQPAIIAGSSLWWDQASEDLARLAELSQIPVFLNGAGRGALPKGHPLLFQHSRKKAISQADAVLVLGTPFDFRLSYGAEPTFSPSSQIVQVDIDAAEVGRNREVEVGIVGDTRSVLRQLIDGWGGTTPREDYLASLRGLETTRRERQRAFEQSDQVPIHHFRLAREMNEVANASGDPMWIADGGNWVAIAAKVVELSRPGRWLDPGPLGCLGVGAPFAIASKILHPDRPAWVIQGDGSFGLNGFDYETMVRFNLPCVIVVGNDAAWGQIRLPQVQLYGEHQSPATQLAAARYDRVIEALGGVGYLVERPEQIRPALERAAASGKVACVNVMLDPKAPETSGSQGYAI
jgi:acetolactate synthase-1/2/3 large subunit